MPVSPRERERRQKVEQEGYGLGFRPASDQVKVDIQEVRITVRVPIELAEQIDEVCDQLGMGRAQFLRMTAKKWLADAKESGKSPFEVLQEVAAVGNGSPEAQGKNPRV